MAGATVTPPSADRMGLAPTPLKGAERTEQRRVDAAESQMTP